MKPISYRILHTIADFERVVDLEAQIWGMTNFRDAAPSNLLHALVANGGLVAGAFAGSDLIGFALGFLALRNTQPILWSHTAGVHPTYQSQRVGFALKQFQRHWALEHGITQIRWTFDPLQARNARFNLNHLGAETNHYYEHFYGDMLDEINVGLPSDRVEALWQLEAPAVVQRAAGEPVASTVLNPTWLVLTYHDGTSPLFKQPDNLTADTYFAEIPPNLLQLKQANLEQALQWRLTLRRVMQFFFVQGYKATDFITHNQRTFYVFTHPQRWYLYVVRCIDDTLYTGITPNIPKRVDQHNRGQGAKYTASRRPVQLIAVWEFADRSAAMRAEHAFKALNRDQKLSFIHQQAAFQKGVFKIEYFAN